MKKGKNSLERVTGMSSEQFSGIKAGSMQQGGEDMPSSNRTVVVEKDRFILNHDTAQSFELVTKYIAKAIANNREEVENALIVTGSPKSVRKLKIKQFNAIVENKLTRTDKDGQVFRQLMTALLSGMYSRQLNKDQFFRLDGEEKSGAFGSWSMLDETTSNMSELNSSTDNVMTLPFLPIQPIESTTSSNNILPYQQTPSGDVEQTKSDTDWGGILSGSAQVIGAIGGVLSLFSGGAQVRDGGSNLDQYNNNNNNNNNNNDDTTKSKKWIWIVVGLVVVGVVIALAVKMSKKK